MVIFLKYSIRGKTVGIRSVPLTAVNRGKRRLFFTVYR